MSKVTDGEVAAGEREVLVNRATLDYEPVIDRSTTIDNNSAPGGIDGERSRDVRKCAAYAYQAGGPRGERGAAEADGEDFAITLGAGGVAGAGAGGIGADGTLTAGIGGAGDADSLACVG